MVVFANSIPKSGTHLLLKLIVSLGFKIDPFWVGSDLIHSCSLVRRLVRKRKGESVTIGCEVPTQINRKWLAKRLMKIGRNRVFGGHCIYTPALAQMLRDSNIKTLCIIRDPRAIAVSHMHYIKKAKRHFFHKAYMALPDDNARLLFSIKGGKLGQFKLESIRERYLRFYRWTQDPSIVMVRFEDLVGREGGGNRELQMKAIHHVSTALGIQIDETEVKTVGNNLFGNTDTFRKGQINGWKSELSDKHRVVMDKLIGDILEHLGYR